MEFSIGDRVLVEAPSLPFGVDCDMVGNIIAQNEKTRQYLIEFDEDISGHDGRPEVVLWGAKGAQGHCWYVSSCFVRKSNYISENDFRDFIGGYIREE